MGFYANHGVEYRITLSGDRWVTVVPMADTDARLLDSGFYRRRKDAWFDPDIIYRSEFVHPIEDPEDLELTAEETNRLQRMLQALEAAAAPCTGHGWFEVNTIGSSSSLARS